jgi:RNA recognition motif-containing protein
MENTEIEKSNILYISNFPKRIEKAELEKILSEYGPLISLNIIQKNEFSFAFA